MSEPAYTDYESCLIYELLGAIDDSEALITNGFSVMLAISDLTVKTCIDTKLAAHTDAKKIRVREILAEYKPSAFDTGSVEAGTAGNLAGVNESAEKDLVRLRQLLLVHVPVMTYAESVKQRNDTKIASGNSSGVPFSRG